MLMKKIKIGIYITRNAIKLLNDIMSEKGGGGLILWLDVRKRGGGIQMRTVCNRGGGGGV